MDPKSISPSVSETPQGVTYVPLAIGLALVFGMIGYLLLASYSDALDSARVTGRNLATTIETRLDATLRRADSILSEVTSALTEEQMMQASSARHVGSIERELDHRAAHFPELAGLRIFDSTGTLLYTNARRNLKEQPHVDDRDFFRRLRDDPSATRVFSKTFTVRSTHTHSIAVAYPIRRKDGRFLGIALALINLDYFQTYLGSLYIGPQGIFAIRRTEDFGLVLRQPNLEVELNKGLPPGNPTREAIVAGKTQATVEFAAKTDGIRRIFSLQVLHHHPYYVLVAIGRDDALAGWNARARLTLGSMLVLVVLLAYQQRRVRRSEQSLQASINALMLSEQFAKTTIDAVPAPICVTDSQGRIRAVNQAWRRFYDQHDSAAASIDHYVGETYLHAWRSTACVPESDVAKMEEGLRQVLAGESSSHELEYSYDTAQDKRTFIARITAFQGNSGNILISHEDITERKQNERELERLVQTDVLTGLASRRHFMALAEQELSRIVRYGGELSVLMMDIDHFKAINDTYGHQVGDQVIQKLGRLCQATLRDIDIVGRIGGEEFAIILPETGRESAAEVAERMRAMIAGSVVPLPQGMPLHFTVSIGVATLAEAETNLDTLLGYADKALYAAKHGGRNRVCVHQPGA